MLEISKAAWLLMKSLKMQKTTTDVAASAKVAKMTGQLIDKRPVSKSIKP